MAGLIEAARRYRKLLEEEIIQNLDDEKASLYPGFHPLWSGNGVTYKAGLRLRDEENVLYTVLQGHISQPDWSPRDAPSLFAKVLVSEGGGSLPWEQPESTNPYAAGDRVLHAGKTWESTIDGNVWEPGIYGWKEFV